MYISIHTQMCKIWCVSHASSWVAMCQAVRGRLAALRAAREASEASGTEVGWVFAWFSPFLGYCKGIILCNFCLFKHVGCLNQFWECDLFSYFLTMILNGFWIQLCSLKSDGFWMFLMSPLHTSCVLLAEDSHVPRQATSIWALGPSAQRAVRLECWRDAFKVTSGHRGSQNLVLFALWQCTGVPVCSVLKHVETKSQIDIDVS